MDHSNVVFCNCCSKDHQRTNACAQSRTMCPISPECNTNLLITRKSRNGQNEMRELPASPRIARQHKLCIHTEMTASNQISRATASKRVQCPAAQNSMLSGSLRPLSGAGLICLCVVRWRQKSCLCTKPY